MLDHSYQIQRLPADHMFAGLPAGAFRAILADPPWYFRGYTKAVSDRDPRRHYDVMTLSQMCALPVGDLAHRDAHLFLWVTGPCLPQAFEVISAWGFRYSGIGFTWIKLKPGVDAERFYADDFHIGLGYTTRKNAEFCLLARRGNAKRRSANVRELVISARRDHSRKPDEINGRVVQYCVGPYVELFARSSRRGWTTWGSEADKYDRVQIAEAAE
jgi:N6-adenosine-specific RNA methylase IME4